MELGQLLTALIGNEILKLLFSSSDGGGNWGSRFSNHWIGRRDRCVDSLGVGGEGRAKVKMTVSF